MDKTVIELKKRINDLAEGIRQGLIKEEDVDSEVVKIIEVAVELYKRDDIDLIMPLNNGGPLLFQEYGKYYVPVYTCKEEIKECTATEYKKVSFSEVCDYVDFNITSFELLDNPEETRNEGIDINEIKNYTDNNPRLTGVMLDPESDDLFSFDGWILKAVIFKGLGADSFEAFDAQTGEKKHSV